jgi:hypothetical protein
MTLRRRAIWLALAASLLLHVTLFTTAPRWSVGEAVVELATVEVTMQDAALPAMPSQPPTPALRPHPKPVAPPPAPTAEPPAELAAAEPIEVAQPEQTVAADGPEVEPEPEFQPEPQPEPEPEPEPQPALPPLNRLPQRVDAEYRLSIGPASAKQTVVWVNEGHRYTLTSAAAATGITRLFYAGTFVQISRGRITPTGLQPETFWDQRGDKHRNARFDAERNEITVSTAGGETRHIGYTGTVQDALSLPFQLALTAPPEPGSLNYQVFTGKKLRDYAYEIRGEAMLDTAIGPLRTLHVARLGHADGRFEIWLAIDRHYLPVRMLRVEDSGAEGELAISALAFTD